ncbi:hypothetical protein [Novipirellula caenicola]|uniref:Uncharacterized protein n=1 Tax=Novipirellula caenicola TaxID=1536901 RepID=A0ABP9W088_9BACT
MQSTRLTQLNFLFLYLWKPAARLLAIASAMFLVTATINAATIAYVGTPPHVPNADHDRLPTAYAWTVLPLVLAGLHVALVAWHTPPPAFDGLSW